MFRAARAVGIHDFIMGLEKGYDTTIEEGGSNLSVGQRQLMSFARALVADPRILILDEATASIDTESEVLVQRALKELLRDRTAVVIAHRLSTIRDADRIVALEEGRVVEQGTHAELAKNAGLYAQPALLQRRIDGRGLGHEADSGAAAPTTRRSDSLAEPRNDSPEGPSVQRGELVRGSPPGTCSDLMRRERRRMHVGATRRVARTRWARANWSERIHLINSEQLPPLDARWSHGPHLA